MKKLLALMATVALLSGCTTKTQYGECIGVMDDKQPNLQYKADTGNIIWAVVLSETIVVPLVVVFADLYCPIDTIKTVNPEQEQNEKSSEIPAPSKIKEEPLEKK